MIIWNLFFSTVLLPLVSIALLWHRERRPVASWVATLLLTSGIVGFSVLAAPWGWFGLWLRYLLVLLFTVAVFGSFRRPIPDPPREESPVRMLLKIVIGLFFGMVAIGALRSRAVPEEAIRVSFPLRGGTFLVVHGGSASPTNMHAGHPEQSFALDLVQINAAGMRASGIYPSNPRRYMVFGAEVISPCNGTVVAAVDGFADNDANALDEKNPAGNHVVVRCSDADLLLAHLQRGSVRVKPGAGVARGEIVGLVGNSGNTTEPHLHVHATRDGKAVPLRFDGRWLVRNDVVRR